MKKWNHTILSCLVSFVQHVYKVYICMLLYVDVICSFSLFCNSLLYEILYFIHSTVMGHLSCFRFGAITNNAAMNILVHVFLYIYACTLAGDYISGREEWLDHKICIYLEFAVNVSFSKWLHQVIFSVQCITSSHYSTRFPTLITFSLSNFTSKCKC